VTKFIFVLFLFSIQASQAEVWVLPNPGAVNCSSGTAGQVYTTNGSTCSFTTVSGTGTVTGPVSSTAHAIATWHDTSGIGLDNNSGFTIASSVMTVANILDSGLTASEAVFTDSSKNLVSVATTGTGSVVLATAPSIATSLTASYATASTAAAFDSSKNLVSSSTTGTELGYVHGVTSAIQTQLAALLPLAGGTLSGDVKTTGGCFVTPKEIDVGNSGASQTVDLSTGTTFTYTLNNATPAFTISNPQKGCSYAFAFTQDGSGSRVPSFSGTTIIWGAGSHTFSTSPSAVDGFSCWYNINITSLMCNLVTAYQ
jgi:hypothetical protein